MRNMLLAILLLCTSSAVFANNEPHCEWDPTKFAHCTYADLANPGLEYSTMVQYKMPDGSFTEPHEWCMAETGELALKMGAPAGTYTMYIRMGYINIQGLVEYKDYASQTFVHNGQGPASPNIFPVHVNANITPVNCMSDTETNRMSDLNEIK